MSTPFQLLEDYEGFYNHAIETRPIGDDTHWMAQWASANFPISGEIHAVAIGDTVDAIIKASHRAIDEFIAKKVKVNDSP